MRLPDDSPWQAHNLAPRIQCPMLTVGGVLDRLAPPSEVRALAEMCGGQFVPIEGAGHTVAIEAPEVWRDAAERFLG